MTELSARSLAQIVNENHRTVSVFEKYHLDFCCQGKRSLQQACEESQVPVDQVITELENITKSQHTPLDFNSFSLTQLADYIVMTHHAYVKEKMPSIYEYLKKVVFKHGERHPELLKIFETFAAVQEEMKQHMEKEEQVLFPHIKALEKVITENAQQYTSLSLMQSSITMLEEEHEHAGQMLGEIRDLTKNYTPPVGACTTYRLSFASLEAFELDLHHHVHLENNILFPKALDLFRKLQKIALN